MEKRCASCGETKPVDEFYLVSKGMPARRSYCKPCTTAKKRDSYQRLGGRDIPYAQVLQRDYGLTLTQYNDMLRNQAHRCAICRRAETVRYRRSGELKRLAVDHDHVTRAVRGLLCQRCNILVWALEDNHTTLDAIRRYVEDFRESFANGPPL